MKDRCARAADRLDEDFEQFYGKLPDDLRTSILHTIRGHFASDEVHEIATKVILRNMHAPIEGTASRIATEILEALEMTPK